MPQLKPVLAVGAVLIAMMSGAALAGGHSGGGRSHGGHASSGARPAVHASSSRHIAFAGGGVIAGAALYASLSNSFPGYYYSPPPSSYSPPPGSPPVVYIEQAPDPVYWYFCPPSNTYYPYVLECSEAWQPVLPEASE